MKLKQAFKDIQKPEDIDQDQLHKYLCALYGDPSFAQEDESYIDDSNPDAVTAYKERVNLLINKLIELSDNQNFEPLRAQFSQDVLFGDTRKTLDEVKQTAEAICYKLSSGEISSPEKFKAEIKSATLDACEAGLLTNIQKVLYSMSDSLYAEKYEYIQNIATQYVRDNKLASNEVLEVHIANELIHEVSKDYKVVPPRDIHARYRDLSINAPEDFAKHVAFQEYLNNHFGSRDGVYSFVESITNSHLSKLPDAKPNEKFLVKAVGKKYDSEAFEQVNLLADSLNITVTSIIQYSDDGQEFEYQENYMSVIKATTIQDLIDQGLIDHDPLTIQRTETTRTYAAPQVIRQEGKAPRVIHDTWGAENISVTQQEIIESPDGWFLAEKIGDRIALGKKLLDTRQLQGLTIEGQNIEDYLHIELSVLLGAGINFEDSLRALIENNENKIELDQPDITNELFLVSDQGKDLTLALSQSGLLSMSVKDLRNWQDENGRTALHYVASVDSALAIDILIKAGVNINAQDKWGNNALHLAAIKGNAETAAKLISAGIDREAKDKRGNTVLHIAAEKGNTEIIDKLILTRAYINAKDKKGHTALHLAAIKGKTEIVAKLIKSRADINAKDNRGQTALHLALKNQNNEIAAQLIEARVNIKSQDSHGRTALHYAAKNGNTEIIDKLLKLGADNEAKDSQGRNALYYAARNGKTEAVVQLINVESDIGDLKNKIFNKKSQLITSLHEAIKNGRTETAAKLIELGVNLGANIDSTRGKFERTALMEAAKNGEIEVVDQLIKLGADMNATDSWDNTALHCAARNGEIEVVNQLIKAGADINAKDMRGNNALMQAIEMSEDETTDRLFSIDSDNNTLHSAASIGNTKILYELIKLGADINAKDKSGMTALHYAVSNNYTELIDDLIEWGADINAQDTNGRTALHYADENGRTNIVTKLIKAGSDINVKDTSGRTALHYADKNEHTNIVTMLIEAGADINAKDTSGNTALHWTIPAIAPKLVDKLIELGADINTKDMTGMTALHYAANNENTKMVDQLIKLGADINVKDTSGRTALHYAASNGNTKMVDQLIKAGADINSKNTSGKTALHYAATDGNTKMVDQLIKAGADINAKDMREKTALLFADKNNYIKIVFKLIEAGADINTRDDVALSLNAKDNHGQTILHHAAKYGNTEAVAMLIELGANLNTKDNNGEIALDISIKKGSIRKIASFLIKDKTNKETSHLINNIINMGSGYIKDHPSGWKLVEDIVSILPKNDRVEIVSNALEEIDNTSRRDRLLGFLPEEERGIASAKVAPTMWQSVRETMELMHGNSSVDVPNRTVEFKDLKKGSSWSSLMSGQRIKDPKDRSR